MTRARKHIVCIDSTPYYHVTSRCVRRAFLCGVDRYTGQSYAHRRQWIEDRIGILSSLFSIELCAYAVMSNHYHLVVRLHPDDASGWSDDEVLERWTGLFRGPLLVQRYGSGESLSAAELDSLRSMSQVFRKRLASLSWFMKCLNEPIARKANREDRCTGHFWEARFHSQPLCSERALIAAMAYVDLNPIRAGLARSPEQSDHTSLKARLEGELPHSARPLRPLMPFASDTGHTDRTALPIRKTEYLKLVDATGRAAIRGKRGGIDAALAPILERLGLSADQWLAASSGFKQQYRSADLKQTA